MKNPFVIPPGTYAFVANSGGKTSGYNLWRHLQANGGTLPPNAAAVFTNTGWEHPATLDFLAEQSRRWGVEINWIEFTRRPATAAELAAAETKASAATARLATFRRTPAKEFSTIPRKNPVRVGQLFDNSATPGQLKKEAIRKAKGYAQRCWWSYEKLVLIGADSYRRVTRGTASTDGRPFTELLEGLERFRREVKNLPGVLPNGVQRICTGHLKVRSAARLAADLWPMKFNDFDCRLGLRADEEDRVERAKGWGRDGGRAAFPLYDAGVVKADVAAFWAGQSFGLSIKSHEGNCGGCYMKKRNALIDLIRRDYFDVSWWSGWESRTGQTFRKDRTYRGLIGSARVELDMIPPDDYDNAITCEGGYCSD